MFATTHRAVADIVSESALKVDSGREIPYHTGDLNLHQYCAYLTHMHTGVSVHSQTHTQTHARTHTCTHTHTHIAQLNTHTQTPARTHTHTHTYTHRGRNYRIKCNTASPLFNPTPHPSPPADKLTGDVAADLPHVVQMGKDLINAGLVLFAFLCPASKMCLLARARSVRVSK